MTKYGHHRIADRLYQRPFLVGNCLFQNVEMIHDAAERRGVADLSIHPRRILQIRKQHRESAYGNLFTRTQRFTRKQIAEDLQRGNLGSRGRVVAPGGPLEDEELFFVGRIFKIETGVCANLEFFIRPACATRTQSRDGIPGIGGA